jgi:hypothetical protein
VVNASPSVFIRAPTNNASFTAVPNLTLVAQATDSDGTISKVEFYQRGDENRPDDQRRK